MLNSLHQPVRSLAARLPNEVLCECFYIVALIDPAPISWGIGVPIRSRNRGTAGVNLLRELAWIRLSHVCCSWRAVLLGMPVLWGRIAFTYPHPAAFSTLMDRAAKAPVDVVLSWKKSHPDPKQEAAFDCLSRARSLTLHSEIEPELLELIPRKPMLSLHHLDLKLDYDSLDRERSPIRSFGEDGEEQTMRDPFEFCRLCIDAPNLRSASLTLERSTAARGRSVVPYLEFTFPALRRLSVYVRDDSTDISDLYWLVNLLRKAPLIEDLTLILRLAQRAPDWETLFKVFFPRLEHLNRLKLEDRSGTRLDTFMSHICPSVPVPSLAVSFDASAALSSELNATSKALEFVRGVNAQSPICRPDDRALTISTKREYTGIAFLSSPALDDPLTYKGCESRVAQLDSSGVEIGVAAVKSSRERPWFDELVQGIQGTEHIEQLYLDFVLSKYDMWLWHIRQELLLRMSAVRTLYFTEPLHSMNDHTKHFLIMGPRDGPLIFPALETLIIWLEGEPESCYTAPEVIVGSHEHWWGSLTLMLERRHAEGVPVKSLCLRGGWESDSVLKWVCDLEAEMLARIKAVVSDVTDERVVLHKQPSVS